MNIFVKFPRRLQIAACRLVFAGVISACSQSVNAQLLFSEAFNYSSGSNLGGDVNPGTGTAWTGGNSVLSIGGSPLSYAGLQSLATTGDLIYTSGSGSASTSINTFSAVTSGSIYYSFLIDCTVAPTANNYLSSLNPSPTGPGGSGDAMAIYAGASGTGWKVGIRNGNSGASYSTALALNTTYLVVGEMTLGATPAMSLFVDPTPGASQPAATATQTGTVAVSSVSDVGFKAQSAATAGDFEFGNLLIAPDWADVTPTAVPEPSSLVLLGSSLVAGWKLRRRQTGL